MRINEHIRSYTEGLVSALYNLPKEDLEAATIAILVGYRCNQTIFIAGNGGSASTASHMACDFQKGTDCKDIPASRRMRTWCINDNIALLSAIANDTMYDNVFADQIRAAGNAGDVLVVISASGNSPNILRAINQAKALGLITVGLLGFDGGQAASLVDCPIIVRSDSYGVIEDCHTAIMHMMTEVFKGHVQ